MRSLSATALSATALSAAAPAAAALAAAALAVLIVVLTGPPGPATAAPARTDVTADIRAGRDITLAGDAVVRLAGDTVSYPGRISGQGSFTIAGTGTLILTTESDFTLPPARQRQRIVTYNGNHPLTRVDNPDPPAVTVEKGATLQYAPGQIGHYVPVPGMAWNALNHRVDGRLELAVPTRVHLGIMSGTGLILARRFVWPGLSLAGTHPFSGTLYNGTAIDYGTNEFVTRLPNIRKIVNQGSAIHGSPDGVVTVDPSDYYSQSYGNDINYHTWGTGVVRNTGVYSWSNNGSDTNPALSSPALNLRTVPHNDNKRGINIEGATVEWGDGTDNRFFLPGNARTAYLNMHFDGRDRSRLTLNYNGPVTLGVPVSGGIYHNTMAAPGQGDIVIAATKGNAVTFAAAQNYDGSTTIGAGASLRLGDGKASGDSGLRLGGRYEIVNAGTLILQNTRKPLTLSKISGPGALLQTGAATATLTGATTYRGPTTVAKGTLRLTGGTLASSSGVNLTAAGTKLDLGTAGAQTVRKLSGVKGSKITLGAKLTVAGGTIAGDLTGEQTTAVTKTGQATLTLAGMTRTPKATWTVRDGALNLTGPLTGDVTVAANLQGDGRVTGDVTNNGTVSASGLTIDGDYTQGAGARLTATRLTVAGTVKLAGTLAPNADFLLDNTGTAAVRGTFDGLPEGATLDGRTITYTGGDGNDVVLAAATTSPTGTTFTAAAKPTGPLATAAITALAAVLALLLLILARRRPPTPRRGAHAPTTPPTPKPELGPAPGAPVGPLSGPPFGRVVGSGSGAVSGPASGSLVGPLSGPPFGRAVDPASGSASGLEPAPSVGSPVGLASGSSPDSASGSAVGSVPDSAPGSAVGLALGRRPGREVGLARGSAVNAAPVWGRTGRR